MKKVKGCLNENCVCCSKRIKYKNEDMFCPKCGSELQYVCRKCYTVLPEDYQDDLCSNCRAKIDDNVEKFKNGAKKAGTTIAGVAVAAVSLVPPIINAVKEKLNK